MNTSNITIMLFTVFAVGLPLWGMQHNGLERVSVSACSGPCYEAWKEESGGTLVLAEAQAAAKAEASPAELGQAIYAGCVACHGPTGGGGIGPQLAGQGAEAISGKLQRYRNGETVGAQSALMWSQAAQLSDSDIDNVAAFLDSL